MSQIRRVLRSRLRDDGTDDQGLTIIELVVAMSIFSIVLAIYFSALISMSQTTVRARDNVDAADALRSTFNVLDHQVRYATSINRPGQGVSGTWYVELEATDLPNSQAPQCQQWRLDAVNNVLSYRTWNQDGTSTATAWRGVAWDVKSMTAGSPFTFSPASGTTLRQSLTVSLKVESPTNGEVAKQESTFIARNSSWKSGSNVDSNLDGASDTPVCLTGMSRS